MRDLSCVRILNDTTIGCHGEPVLWTHLIRRLCVSFVDCASSATVNAKTLRLHARAMPSRPTLWVQNASWNPPHAGGPEPYVAVLMDNLRRLNDERAIAQRMVLEDATWIVANSDHFLDDYREFSSKMTVIPLGVDTDFFAPPESHPDRTRKRAIFVGDATAQKGFYKVVSLASAREDIDWTFFLKSFHHDVMVPGRLFVRVSRERVRDLLQEADVFVLGSVAEGGSMCPLEAMACDVPVVMPPAGDFATWKPMSYFEVAAPYGPREMGIALDRCLASRSSPRGDLLAAGRYDVVSVVASWRALLEGILNDGRESVLGHKARASS